ncbi:Uncharacterized protein TPAR_05446 [Tolypocladium paradoxum]|uniref:Zn(2)-C6 fungal-type domain-containing protein n=1 Tax=Tolypocladium paradoxum TaxID=94208 RepID=A0A2S4KVZ6_9HYPO|nr:Uncharacterized protein TPAR_05446 [Tolypocladium paradoxum]
MIERQSTDSEAEAPPPPSSSPAAKRRRITKACDQCRAARRKCDSLAPVCSGCLWRDQTCTYDRKTKRRGTQAGYVGALEAMLALLLEEGGENRELVRGFLVRPWPGATGNREDDDEDEMNEDGDSDVAVKRRAETISVYNVELTTRLRRSWRKDALFKNITTLLACDDPPQVNGSSKAQDLFADPDQESSSGARRCQGDSDEAVVAQWPIFIQQGSSDPMFLVVRLIVRDRLKVQASRVHQPAHKTASNSLWPPLLLHQPWRRDLDPHALAPVPLMNPGDGRADAQPRCDGVE